MLQVFFHPICHSGPENLKKSRPKNLSNEITPFHGFFFGYFLLIWDESKIIIYMENILKNFVKTIYIVSQGFLPWNFFFKYSGPLWSVILSPICLQKLSCLFTFYRRCWCFHNHICCWKIFITKSDTSWSGGEQKWSRNPTKRS